jgi:hypothetical protein
MAIFISVKTIFMIPFFKKINYSLFKVIVLGSLSVLFSCSDDDDQPLPVEQQPACRPTRILVSSNESKFEYDVLIKFIGAYNNYIKFGYKNNRVEELTYYYDMMKVK